MLCLEGLSTIVNFFTQFVKIVLRPSKLMYFSTASNKVFKKDSFIFYCYKIEKVIILTVKVSTFRRKDRLLHFRKRKCIDYNNMLATCLRANRTQYVLYNGWSVLQIHEYKCSGVALVTKFIRTDRCSAVRLTDTNAEFFCIRTYARWSRAKFFDTLCRYL